MSSDRRYKQDFPDNDRYNRPETTHLFDDPDWVPLKDAWNQQNLRNEQNPQNFQQRAKRPRKKRKKRRRRYTLRPWVKNALAIIGLVVLFLGMRAIFGSGADKDYRLEDYSEEHEFSNLHFRLPKGWVSAEEVEDGMQHYLLEDSKKNRQLLLGDIALPMDECGILQDHASDWIEEILSLIDEVGEVEEISPNYKVDVEGGAAEVMHAIYKGEEGKENIFVSIFPQLDKMSFLLSMSQENDKEWNGRFHAQMLANLELEEASAVDAEALSEGAEGEEAGKNSEIPITEQDASKIGHKDFLYYTENSDFTYCVSIVTNFNDFDVKLTGEGKFIKDGEEVFNKEQIVVALGPEQKTVVIFVSPHQADDCQVDFNAEPAIEFLSINADISYSTEKVEETDDIAVTATNNSDHTAEFVKGIAIFYKEGNVIYSDSAHFINDNQEFPAGESITQNLRCYLDYDEMTIYWDGRAKKNTARGKSELDEESVTPVSGDE